MAGVFQARMEEELAVPCWFRHNWNPYYQDDRRIFWYDDRLPLFLVISSCFLRF